MAEKKKDNRNAAELAALVNQPKKEEVKPAPTPTPAPVPTLNSEYDPATLSGRFLNAGVNPNQPSIQANPALYNQMVNAVPRNQENLKNARLINNIPPAETLAPLPERPPQLQAGIEVAAPLLHPAAQAIAAITSFLPEFLQFGTRKSIEASKAEQSFTDASSIVSQDIKAIQSGSKSLIDVQRDIDKALEAINRLEEHTSGLGKFNLRYWIDEGAELENQILSERAYLENQRLEAIAAARAFQIQSAQINQGVTG